MSNEFTGTAHSFNLHILLRCHLLMDENIACWVNKLSVAVSVFTMLSYKLKPVHLSDFGKMQIQRYRTLATLAYMK